jgi:hypothetical protein
MVFSSKIFNILYSSIIFQNPPELEILEIEIDEISKRFS